MSTKISVGDTVEVLELGSADSHMLGVKGRVIDAYPSRGRGISGPTNVLVEDPTGNGMWSREGGVSGWWFRVPSVKKVEEDLAEWEKELLGIETKQEHEFKAGDTVEAIESMSGATRGEQYKVARLEDPEDGKRALVHTECGQIAYAKRFELVSKAVVEAEKPKARSQEIKLEDVQKGDLIVAFWEQNGIEYRQKGTVHEISGGCPFTLDGGLLAHNLDHVLAEHIYLIERPEKPVEPEIADGTYYVTSTMEGVGPWQVTVANGVADWEYGDKWQHQAFGSYESLVQAKKGLRSDMVFHTEDPTPAPKPVDGMYRINEKDSSGKFEAFWSVREGVAYEGHTREAARSQGHPVNEGWFKRMFAGDTVYFNIPVLEPKSIQEQLDELGVKAGDVYRWQDSRAFYLFDGAGKVKVLASAPFTREVHIAEVEAIVDGHLQKV